MIKFLTIYFGLVTFFAAAQTSPFNGLEIENDSTGNYKFIVSGHFYGNSSNGTGYPVNTILGNINHFNSSNSDFFICLGDLFLDVSNDIPFYKKTLFSDLDIPLFNTVGNHDVSGSIYEDNFGERTNIFVFNQDCHIIIDTEIDNGNLEQEQIDLLLNAKSMAEKGEIKNLFVYGHRTLWVEHYAEMDGLFEDNTQSLTGNNFGSEIIPILEEIGEHCSVHWFAGSLGNAPASFFYHFDEARNIKYIATAVRGLPRDAVLYVESNNGAISFSTESLTGQDLNNLEDYNTAFWQENTDTAPPFNWRLVPLYIKNAVFNRYFWYGFLAFLGLLIVGKPIIKRFKKSNS